MVSTEGSSSLKIRDANPSKKKDYSITISSQPKFKPKSTITEKTFYKLTVKGTDQMANDNQTNLAPKMTSVGQLSADKDNVSEPTDAKWVKPKEFSPISLVETYLCQCYRFFNNESNA